MVYLFQPWLSRISEDNGLPVPTMIIQDIRGQWFAYSNHGYPGYQRTMVYLLQPWLSRISENNGLPVQTMIIQDIRGQWFACSNHDYPGYQKNIIKPLFSTKAVVFSRAGNLLIRSLLFRSFAHFAQIKWATVSDLLRSLKTNEWPWAIRSGRSEEISGREQITQKNFGQKI